MQKNLPQTTSWYVYAQFNLNGIKLLNFVIRILIPLCRIKEPQKSSLPLWRRGLSKVHEVANILTCSLANARASGESRMVTA